MITNCAGCPAQVLQDHGGGFLHVGSLAVRECDDPRPLFPPARGQIVHYVLPGSLDGRFPASCRMAFVTATDEAAPFVIGLSVINPAGYLSRPRDVAGVVYGPGDPAEGAEGAAGARCGIGDRSHLPETWHRPEDMS